MHPILILICIIYFINFILAYFIRIRIILSHVNIASLYLLFIRKVLLTCII